jgi:hypothetical protein
LLGVDLDRPRHIGDRAVEVFAFLLVGARQAAIAVGHRIPRIELDGLARVGDRLIVIFLAEISSAARGIGVGKVRIDFDRLVVVGDGGVELPQLPVHLATKQVGDGEVVPGKRVRLDQSCAGGERWLIGIDSLAQVPVPAALGPCADGHQQQRNQQYSHDPRPDAHPQ